MSLHAAVWVWSGALLDAPPPPPCRVPTTLAEAEGEPSVLLQGDGGGVLGQRGGAQGGGDPCELHGGEETHSRPASCLHTEYVCVVEWVGQGEAEQGWGRVGVSVAVLVLAASQSLKGTALECTCLLPSLRRMLTDGWKHCE